MTDDDLKIWRKTERARLIAARLALDAASLEQYRQQIDAHITRAFAGLALEKLAFCWPMRGEYDARPLLNTLRARGTLTALPVVLAPRTPLVFRAWHPGVALAKGPLEIPYPVHSAAVVPDAVLLPMNGWDPAGYRLGYGGGFFDRTLVAFNPKPTVIGVAYELARMQTIHPQSWDIPVDWLVTERGVYQRRDNKLAFLDEHQD